MKDIANNPIPSGISNRAADHDFKSVDNVEKHLRAELEIELRDKTIFVSPSAQQDTVSRLDTFGHYDHPSIERRINRRMHISDCYPNGKLALRGTLSDFSRTKSKDTHRAFLRHQGNIMTILSINFETGDCQTCGWISILTNATGTLGF